MINKKITRLITRFYEPSIMKKNKQCKPEWTLRELSIFKQPTL